MDQRATWRIFYRVDHDAIVIGEVTKKKTQRTPKIILETCKRRFARYDLDQGR